MATNHLMHPRTAHNHADNGYFPTDDATLAGITARLDIAGGDIRIFDPCCGTGSALAVIGEHLAESGASCHSFGVELDKGRAQTARSLLDTVIQGDIESCILQPRTVGLLFLNPPYGFTAADNLSNNRTKRLEEIFFDLTVPALQDEGVMVLVIPVAALTEKLTFEIASRFTGLRMYKAAVDTYRQVVIFGIKPKNRNGIGKTLIKQQQQMLLQPETAVPVDQAETDFWYEIPESAVKPFRPLNYSVEAEGLAEELETLMPQTLWPHFGSFFGEGLLQEKRWPLCALGKWHAALALAAGQVNGIVTSPDGRRLLIKGSTHKTKVTTTEEQVKDDGSVQYVTTNLDRFVPSIRAIDLTAGSAEFGDVLTIK